MRRNPSPDNRSPGCGVSPGMSAPLPDADERLAPAEPPEPEPEPVDLGPIYRDARPRLIRLAVLLVDDLATAEDVVQDVFVRLHRRGGAPIESIDGYLTTAVLNTARSTLRRRRVAAGGRRSATAGRAPGNRRRRHRPGRPHRRAGPAVGRDR